ncbi:hypothetical protein C5L39_10270 [Corynebacterium alimapuense]|uniref:ABC transporter n=2 Tax=Corynebacterium alimapuense TaxID=1576874 RepID=A0A3M8K4T4_9CORY|nr:hypothetical protein C5L39_10270 [Corynebacterium alimapuense]
MRKRAGLTAGLLTPALLVGLAACSATAEEPDTISSAATPTSETPHGYVKGAEEATESQLRLTVADAETDELTMVDLLTGETVDMPSAAAGGTLKDSDGRFLFTGDDAGFNVIDSGVWTVDHGDHSHYYVSDPAEVGTVDGDTPGHAVSNDSQVAMFFDGDGTVTVLPRTSLDDGVIDESVSFQVGEHHGVAVPFDEHVLSTVPAADATDLPAEITLFDNNGEDASAQLTGDISCPEIHGTAASAEHVSFACADGLLTVNEDFNAAITAYPSEADGRAWSLTAGDDIAVAPFDGSGLGILNIDTGNWTVVETGAPVLSTAIAPDDSTVFAIDEDGTGYAIDAASGEITAQRELVEIIGDDSDAPRPAVALTQERGYVSDPETGTVLEIDLADDLREARSFELGGQPSAIAITGDN